MTAADEPTSPETAATATDLSQPALTWLISEGPLAGRACKVFPSGSWVCVDGTGPGEPQRFAIWRRTGAVYRVQEEGEPYPEAVGDDPIWTPSA